MKSTTTMLLGAAVTAMIMASSTFAAEPGYSISTSAPVLDQTNVKTTLSVRGRSGFVTVRREAPLPTTASSKGQTQHLSRKSTDTSKFRWHNVSRPIPGSATIVTPEHGAE